MLGCKRMYVYMYLIYTWSTLGNETNNYRSFTAGHKSKTHFGAALQYDHTWFGWLIIVMVQFGCFICSAFIKVAAPFD